MNAIFADLRDEQFKQQEGAIFVKGFFGDPYMDQFPGMGYSKAEFKFKALMIMIDGIGIVYIPDPRQNNLPKNRRDWANCPMVRARIQPPAWAIEYFRA